MSKTGQSNKKDKRSRYQYRFWIDANKDEQLLLGEELETFKAEKRFQPTVITALKLFLSLLAGRVDVLLDLFPFVEDYFKDKLKNETIPTLASDDFERMLKYQAMILEQLQRNPAHSNEQRETSLLGMGALENLADSVFVQTPKSEEEIKAEASAARVEFAAGLGNMFNEDDSDLWDD